jgi:hypothetical protein
LRCNRFFTQLLKHPVHDSHWWILRLCRFNRDRLAIYCLWPEYNPLKKCGVEINREATASASLDSFEIHIKGQRPGYDDVGVTGEHLVFQYRDLDGDGVEEILIQSGDRKDSRTVLKVLMENNKAVAFHVLETHFMCIGYYRERLHCP